MLVQIDPGWNTSAAGTLSPYGRKPVGDAQPVGVAAADISTRPARISDMKAIEPLIRDFATANLMLPKTYDQLVRNFREFVVAVDPEDKVVGCGSLRIYNDDLAEVCSLAVASGYHGLGIGRKIVERLADEAFVLGIDTMFALTLEPDFFQRLDFEVVPKDNFPLKVWADCRNCPKLHACDEVAVSRSLSR